MVFKVKTKKRRIKDTDEEVIDDLYSMGEDVAQKSNPFFLSGKTLGYDDDKQKKLNNKIKKK